MAGVCYTKQLTNDVFTACEYSFEMNPLPVNIYKAMFCDYKNGKSKIY